MIGIPAASSAYRPYPGHYARIEGHDFTGKSTLLELAREYDQRHGLGTVFVREPGGTPLGQELRHILLTNTAFRLDAVTEALIFTADRNHLISEIILPALREARPVVSDRGVESMLIYQSAGGKISRKSLEQLSSLVLPPWYLRPDALLVLNVSPEEKKRRQLAHAAATGLALDKIESRDDAYQQAVSQGYTDLSRVEHAVPINADPSPEEVFETAKPYLFGRFAR